MTVISVENVSKTYKTGFKALNQINLSVASGEIFSLLGENGAGKSTLIKLLTTFSQPSNGTIQILGKNVLQNRAAIRKEVACVAQQTSIDSHLSLTENLLFQSRLYKIPQVIARKRITELVSIFQLESYQEYPVAAYSGGIKRRLDIAMNMMSAPKILFLDEPTTGMDIQSRKNMWELIRRINQQFKTTIFLTTHYLEEADHLSDTVCIMKAGKEIVQKSPKMLREIFRQKVLEVEFPSVTEAEKIFSLLRKTAYKERILLKEQKLQIMPQDLRASFAEINLLLLNSQIRFNRIGINEPTLDDVFLKLTK